MRDHPQFGGWEIIDIGKQPMDLISSDKQVYFHLRRNEEKARIDLDSANPGLCFHSSRGIRKEIRFRTRGVVGDWSKDLSGGARAGVMCVISKLPLHDAGRRLSEPTVSPP
jgi:hypothetical protein